ncbi:MAG: hypothetical protein K8U03_11550 [Planctomycetia bacterium]|nr:hypothetical protein [Planctomycetia bacterium]
MPRISALLLFVVVGTASSAEPNDQTDLEFFESRIRPIFVEHCYKCHSGQAQRIEGGLRVDSRTALLNGGDSGAVVVPGRPDESLLITAVSYSADASNMPPAGKLNDRSIADLRNWVKRGARMPHGPNDAAVGLGRSTCVQAWIN